VRRQIFCPKQGVVHVSFLNPLLVFVASIALFIVLLYRRVGLGVSLTLATFLMSLLSIGISDTGTVLIETCVDPVTLTLVFASFFVMLLSLLYKETGLVNVLTRSLGRFIKNSKVIVSLLPAIIGLMPVAGGALMSAPMVEAEADKLGLNESKKTYVNVWFRHAILPIYPISQFLILTAILTETTLGALIVRQLLVVIVMIAVGYVIGLRRTKKVKQADSENKPKPKTSLKELLYSFSPIIITILLAALLNLNIAIATLVGVIALLVITRTKTTVFRNVLKKRALWEVTLAAFGALLLRNVTLDSGASEILGNTLAGMSLNWIILLSVVPAVLGFLLGSPSGAVALSVPILAETVTFIPKTASLLYISAYLGYLIAPTHLCLAFTAQYFECPITKSYKYLIPSTAISIIAALATYLLI
jgi:integral membrane protein (TIGR00529 family)